MTRSNAILMLNNLAEYIDAGIVSQTGPAFDTLANTVEDILSEAEWLDMMELAMPDLLRAIAGFIRAGDATQVVFDIFTAVVTFVDEYSK